MELLLGIERQLHICENASVCAAQMMLSKVGFRNLKHHAPHDDRGRVVNCNLQDSLPYFPNIGK